MIKKSRSSVIFQTAKVFAHCCFFYFIYLFNTLYKYMLNGPHWKLAIWLLWAIHGIYNVI